MKNTILESFDTWTRAQTIKSNGRTAGVDNQRLLGIDKLRELILELAVRGKLVPQDEKEEPASELIKKISKAKKNKSKAKIEDTKPNEMPFDLPDSWLWQRLLDIGHTQTGGTPNKNNKEFFGNDIPFIKPGDIYPSYIDYSNEGLSFLGKENLGRTAEKGSLLMVCIGTIGKCNIIDRDCTFNQQINSVSPYLINSKYLLIALRSNFFQKSAWEKSSSTTIAILNKGNWENLLIPIPPLAEQHRIVAKVDELMALCDQLELQQTENNFTHHQLVQLLLQSLTEATSPEAFATAWLRIATNFDTLFSTEYSIDQLKQTLLQLAVMGKLVPQDPKDEPASELLKKIAKQKERLVKEGKIKKQEKLPEIADEEKPFELPRGWEWTKLGNMFDVTSSKRIHVSDYVDEGIPFFRSKEIGELGRGEEIKTAIFISKEKFEILKGLPGFPHKNDLMLASIGASIGNNWICDERTFYYKDGNITKIGSHEFANMRYLQIFISSPLLSNYFTEGVAGSAYNALTIVKIKDLLYPLPPFSEQHCIVAKVDELFALCDALKERIKEAQETQGKLAECVVEGVLG